MTDDQRRFRDFAQVVLTNEGAPTTANVGYDAIAFVPVGSSSSGHTGGTTF